jgi:ATP-binding protein involved in chromosome partitioning
MPLPMLDEPQSPLPTVGRVLAVAAGKGGVGKSTVAVNLALALKKLGQKVGILDGDLYGPSVRKMLPEDRLPGRTDDKLTPALCWGVSVMSMAFLRGEGEAAIVRAPIANRVIDQFLQQVEWGDLDTLLIDFPPGTGDIPLTLGQKAGIDGVVLVTTPQEIALMDVRKAVRLFEQLKLPITGVVENMSGSVFGSGGGASLAKELGVPLLGEVPLDPELCQAADQGRSLLYDAPESPAAQAFMDIARSLLPQGVTA